MSSITTYAILEIDTYYEECETYIVERNMTLTVARKIITELRQNEENKSQYFIIVEE